MRGNDWKDQAARAAGRRDLPEGRDQSGDLLHLEEEIRGNVANRDEAAEAARG